MLDVTEEVLEEALEAAADATEAMERKHSERERMLRFRGVRCKCVVQLLLIDSAEETFFKHGER